MDIDIYQHCPCHSGKKIKFCCGKDIVADLNQIVAKCNSNQSLSALDQIERGIARHGEKDCLLNLQTHILFTMGEIQKAEESNQKFVSQNPHHPIGKQHEALIELSKGNAVTAIEKLQDAMDLIKDDEIPLPMANAFKLIGGVLLSAGHIIAARAHLQFALMVKGEGTDEIKALLAESFRMAGAPMLLKTDYRLDAAPANKDWSDKYDLVVGTLNRGQFRLALKMLMRMDEHWQNEPEIVRGIAVVKSMLADEENMSDAWHRVAELPGIPNWQAVEAEALAQIFLDADPSGELDIMAVSRTIKNLDEAFQTIESNKRFTQAATPEQDPFENGPPPRYAYYVVDREVVEHSEDLTANDIPLVAGEILLYGKQTDRDSKLVYVATRNESYDKTVEFLDELLGDHFDGPAEEEVLSTTSVAADALAWNWNPPQGITVEKHRELIAEYRKDVLLEKWPNLSFSCLQNKTPLQAKDDEKLAIPLAAMVLNLEQSSLLQMSGQEDLVSLKNLLGIEHQDGLDAAEHSDEVWTPLRLRSFAPGTFTDEQLVHVYADSITIGHTQLLKRIIPEILKRDSLEQIPRDVCYSMMAQLTEDDNEAIDYLQQARQEAKTSGRSIGQLLVQEFEVRLTRGLTDKLPELLQTIQQKHMGEPNVEYQLMRVLTKYGLISPDGRSVSLPAAPPRETTETESKIWTPDSDDAVAAPSGESKIWVPGSD